MLADTVSQAARLGLTRAFETTRATEARDPAEALAEYDAILQRNPRNSPEAHSGAGRLLEVAGAYAEAEPALRPGPRRCDGYPVRCPTRLQEVASHGGTAARSLDPGRWPGGTGGGSVPAASSMITRSTTGTTPAGGGTSPPGRRAILDALRTRPTSRRTRGSGPDRRPGRRPSAAFLASRQRKMGRRSCARRHLLSRLHFLDALRSHRSVAATSSALRRRRAGSLLVGSLPKRPASPVLASPRAGAPDAGTPPRACFFRTEGAADLGSWPTFEKWIL